MSPPDVDVAIAGAGPAGAGAALFAARAGFRVAIFDSARFPRDKPCGEGLMPSGRLILKELGLENAVAASGAPTLEGLAVGLSGGPSHAIPFPLHGDARWGLGVRRLHFDALLAEQLAQHPRIAFHQGTAVEDVISGDGRAPQLMTAEGPVVARFVAVADGLRSGLRHRLGWTRGPKPPHRYAVLGHWHTDAPIDPWVRVTVDSGFELYEGPVGPQERLVALLCHRRHMKAFAGSRLTAAYREAVVGLRPTLRGASLEGEAVATGPFRYDAAPVARAGVFLIGDAAGFVDPISGEGIASGFLQARAFVAALGQAQPERTYRRAHRRLTRDPRRAAGLLVYLSGSPARAARGLRGLEHAPAVMSKLLGVLFGYWGFSRLTPREWVAMLFGR